MYVLNWFFSCLIIFNLNNENLFFSDMMLVSVLVMIVMSIKYRFKYLAPIKYSIIIHEVVLYNLFHLIGSV